MFLISRSSAPTLRWNERLMSLLSSYVSLNTNKYFTGAARGNSASDRREMPADRPAPMIEALARAMAARDASTHEHARRVQRYAPALAREIAIGDERTLAAIDAAALLHDIGKLGIPDRILGKPGPLTPDEYDHVKLHAIIGADILSAVSFPGPLAVIVRHHHENWDGTGYPDGLRGEAIPIGSRVLAIVDCYDALTSDRPYRRALSHVCAVAMIHERRGTMYDSEIVSAFLRVLQRMDRLGLEMARAV
jgi:putative nucleotidyltransferase with HDIG domain